MNTEFQRQQEKKVFLSKQCNGMEENNRIGKTRDYLKKIGDIKGTFHARMGIVKDRNGEDLKEEKRLRRGGNNTQKKYVKKVLETWITTVL